MKKFELEDREEPRVPILMVLFCFAAAVLFALLVNGCPTPEPKPPSPAPTVDVDNSTPPCDEACANLAALNCKEALPTAEGTTCEQVCENAVQEGHPLNTKCVAAIKKCEELNTVCR